MVYRVDVMGFDFRIYRWGLAFLTLLEFPAFRV